MPDGNVAHAQAVWSFIRVWAGRALFPEAHVMARLMTACGFVGRGVNWAGL